MTLKNNRAPLISNIKLYASLHHHMWNQTGVTVRKRLSWVLTSVTLTFDSWPWPFAWTSLLSLVITPENFMMIRCWEHNQKGVTDRRTEHSYSCLVAAKNKLQWNLNQNTRLSIHSWKHIYENVICVMAAILHGERGVGVSKLPPSL